MKVLNESIKSVLHVCSNHNLHSWKRFFDNPKDKGDARDKGDADSQKLKKKVKKRFMGSLCRMMMARDYEFIKQIFYHLAVVSMNKSNCFKFTIYVLFIQKTINLFLQQGQKQLKKAISLLLKYVE